MSQSDKDGVNEPMAALKRLQDKLVAMGVKNIGFTWAPGAEKLTTEERAASVLQMFEAMERGDFEEVKLDDTSRSSIEPLTIGKKTPEELYDLVQHYRKLYLQEKAESDLHFRNYENNRKALEAARSATEAITPAQFNDVLKRIVSRMQGHTINKADWDAYCIFMKLLALTSPYSCGIGPMPREGNGTSDDGAKT